MRSRFFYFLLLLYGASICGAPLQAQDPKADSLNHALLLAKHDTVKIKLQYLRGMHLHIDRTSYWDSLLANSRRLNLPVFTCRALGRLCRCYWMQNNHPLAFKLMDDAMSVADKRGLKQEMILLLKSQKTFYTGNGKKLLDVCYKGLQLAEEIDDQRSVIDFYSSIGVHYLFVGEAKKALQMHFKCLAISKKIHYNIGIVGALIDIGSDYHALKDFEKKRACFFKCKPYLPEFDGTYYGVCICTAVAGAYGELKHFDSAHKYSYKGYLIARKIHDKVGMASSLVVVSGTLYDYGRLEEAEKYCLEALTLARETKFVTQLPDLYLILRGIHIKQHDYKKALEDYELHVRARDSLVNEKNRKDAIGKEFSYNYEKKETENKLLAKENLIQQLQLRQHKSVLTGVGIGLFFILIISYLLLRQSRIKTTQQSLQLEQKLMRSQMNPHFIFNSLNSIQQFIVSGQNEKAELYLSKFSKLVRELLESNMVENISIQDEAAILQNYIEMEALRFRNTFTFSVTIGEKIIKEHQRIPHMMIQPFVENAIWHGLLPKENNRHLQVLFEADTPKTVCCIIDDNGVGRAASIKKETTFKKKSLALGFIKHRIELLRKTLKVNCSVNIIDKTSETGLPTGTRVIIVLPLMK